MSSRIRRFLVVLLLSLITALPLRQAIVGGSTIGPFDQVRQMAPWNGPKPDQPWDVIQVDGVLQFYGWRDLVLESWGKGRIPAWNPYELAGYPLLANSQSGAFYPPHIVLGVLHIPTPLAINLLAWFHLFWAALGVYWLTRRLGADRHGAVVAASGFALSSFMLSWTALGSVITTVSWIPWALGAFAQRPGRRDFAIGAFSVAMMLLAGHLQFAAYGMMAIVLFGFSQAALDSKQKTSQRLIQVALPLGVILLGSLVALPQLKPVLDYGKYSHRKNEATAQGYQDYLNGSLKSFEVANLTNATNLGDPRNPAIGIGQSQSLSSYWPPVAKRGATFADSAITIGPLVLALFAFVPWHSKGAISIGVVGTVGLLLALGSALNWPLYFLVPSWSSTGMPSRAGVLFILAANVLAGIGFTHARMDSPQKLKILGVALAAGFSILCAFVLPGLAPAVEGQAQPLLTAMAQVASAEAVSTTGVSLFVCGLALLVLLLPAGQKYRQWAVLAPTLMFAVSAMGLRGIVPTGKPLDKVEGVPAHDRIAVINGPWDLLTAAPALLPPNTASESRIHEIGGYDSLLHRDTVAFLNEINGQDPAPPANGNMMFIKPTANLAKLAEAGVSQVWSRRPLPPEFGKGVEAKGYRVYPVAGPGRVSAQQGTPTITEEDSSSLTVTTEGVTGLLIVRDAPTSSFVSNWTATADSGQVLPLQEGPWLKVQVPPGTRQIQFRYSPPGIGWTPWVAFLAVLSLVVMAFPFSRKAVPE